MKKTILALSVSALSVSALAQGKKPEPEITLTGNFALVSDYRFRGISQTDKKPATQGGFDIATKSGAYAGIWTSNVSQWTATGASQEVDLYGGYKASLPMDIGLDVGYIVAGIVLATRSQPLLKGFGWAVVVQGLFLLIFDLTFLAWT